MSPYEIGREFAELFSRYEHALKRGGFLRKDTAIAQADWRAFGRTLGDEFFNEVRRQKIAETLIEDPPGRLMRDNLAWARPERPLGSSVDLFECGVCRVRNSLFHGEKFVGDAEQMGRDTALVTQALAVLHAAMVKVESVAKLLANTKAN